MISYQKCEQGKWKLPERVKLRSRLLSGNSLKVQTTWTKKNHEQASLKRVDGIDKAIANSH